MHDPNDSYLSFGIPILIIGYWFFLMYIASLLSGWRLLAQRFRDQNSYSGPKWHMQGANMRFMSHYNNCLTIGADNSGLFAVPVIFFRMWHPVLFIPWSEITFERKKRLFFINVVQFRLGNSERVPFTVYAALGARIEEAAGPNWPTPYYRATSSPPPPIE